ncbi:uncharacterized protein LOC135836078 [Planococcus citri]|uniref:uncharacterized protein LOC135836078 n=1 Tax=Planococcus citri TaxID=170843 RepID=UPI0031F802B8
MSFLGSVILLLITFLFYIYWRFKKSHQFFDKNGIPYLKPTIIFGNIGDTFLKKKPMPVLHLELYRKLEPHKFGGFFNFHTPFVMIRDPELIKHILIKDFAHFHDRGININTEVDRLGNHLLAMAGEEWKNLRVKLTSTFTSGKMKMMFPLVKNCGDKLAQVLETMIREPIDVKDLCARFTTDVIGSCAFGIETHSLDDPNSEFRKMGNRIFEFRYKALLLSAYPDMPRKLMKWFDLRFVDKEVEDFLMSIVESTVQYREENKVSRHDFIDLLLSLKNETMAKYQDHGEKEDLDHFLSQVGSNQSKSKIEMTIDLMAAQCFIFFGAGFETSSTNLGFLMLELAQRPDIQKKLRDEINSVIDNNPEGFTYELLTEMPYVDMVISEGLRKYPATGFALRQCTIDYKLPNTNIVIPKKTPVTIPIFGLHRDPKYYERPEDFYPEHFTKEAIAERPHYTYMPFGEGPRACIGERFAKMQVKIGLISMLRNFSFELSSQTTLPVEFQRHFILLKAKGGIWLQCKKLFVRRSLLRDMSFFGSVILVLIAFLYYLYWRFKKSHQFFDKNGIPYSKPTILFGNIGDTIFKKKPMPVLHLELYRQLEPHKFGGYFNFQSPFVMIRDPELIKHVMIKDFVHFHDRGFKINTDVDRLGNHLLAMEGEDWKNLRVKLTSAFTSGKMKMMFPLVKQCGDKLAQVLESVIEESIDVKDLCARFTTDVIGSCAFGIETHSLDDPNSEFRKMGNRIFEFRYQALILSIFSSLPTQLVKLLNLKVIDEEVEEFLISTIENTVKYREQNNVSRQDFIDLLLSLKNDTMAKYRDYSEQEDQEQFLSQVGSNQSKNKLEMTIQLMAAQCFIFFGAGFETSSTALGFLMLELAQNQDIQNKLRDEINTVINNNPEGFTYEVLKEMPYVDMVIAEVLRKYPATGFAIRECTIDYKLPNTDIVIPKHTKVTVPIFGLHRDPKYYDRPEDFYPEHFTKEAIAKRPHYTYMPFGEGPRACIGERFAKMQVKIGLISMLRNFSFELSPQTILPVEFQRHFILLKAKGGIWLRCKKI